MTAYDAALVSALTSLIVVILTNGISRLLEVRRRHDKRLDLVSALHAEITAGLYGAEEQTSETEETYINLNDTPYGPADDTDFVFDSIKSDLTLLPMDVIHEVVSYYKLSRQSILLVNGMTDPLFYKQTAAERRKYVKGYLALLKEEARAGKLALEALEKYAAKYMINLADKRQIIEKRWNEPTVDQAKGPSGSPPPDRPAAGDANDIQPRPEPQGNAAGSHERNDGAPHA